MRKIHLFILITLATTFAKADVLPSIEQVLTEFHSKYIYTKDLPNTVRFAKKKDGWYAYEADLIKNNSFNEQLFWSLQKKDFLPLNFDPIVRDYAEAELIIKINEYFYYNGSRHSFERCRYFGYNGWDRDMIRDFNNFSSNTPDTLLEGIQRAYSNYAHSFMFSQYEYSSRVEEQKKMPLKLYPDSFANYVRKGIKAIKFLVDKNPSYQVIVGSARNKYANEFIYAWNVLSIAGYKKEASGFIEQNIYDLNVLRTARNYLSGLRDSAVLFTNGDNDTYPLWYVQQSEGFRKDVKVINMSLLNLPSYIAYLNRDHNLGFSQSMSFYQTDASAYLVHKYLYSDTAEVEAARFFTLIDKTETDQYYFYRYSWVRCRVYSEDKTKVSSVIRLNGKNLFRGDLAVCDILATNGSRYPCFFAPSVGSDKLDFFNASLLNEGMAYRFYPANEEKNDVFSPQQANNISKFLSGSFQALDYKDPSISENFKTLSINQSYYHKVYRDLYTYLNKYDKAAASTCLKKWGTILPPVKQLIGYGDLMYAYTLMEAKDPSLEGYLSAWFKMLNERYSEEKSDKGKEEQRTYAGNMTEYLSLFNFYKLEDKFKKEHKELF